MLFNQLMRFVVSVCHAQSGFAGFGVGVANIRTNGVGNFTLDRAVQTATGNPIAIIDFHFAIRSFKFLVDTNNIFSEFFEVFFQTAHSFFLLMQQNK